MITRLQILTEPTPIHVVLGFTQVSYHHFGEAVQECPMKVENNRILKQAKVIME